MLLSQWRLVFWQAFLLTLSNPVVIAVVITSVPSTFVGLQAGGRLQISWADASGAVTLTLKNGEANAMKTVKIVASELTGTSFIWSIPSNLPTDFYALQVDDSSGVPNYSVRFEIQGVDGPVSSSSTPISTSSSSSIPTTSTSSSTSSKPILTFSTTSSTSSTSQPIPLSSTTSLSTSSSSSQATSTLPSSATTSPPTSLSAASSSSPSSRSSGLSTGAKAGIGVGAALVFLIFVGLAFWWGRRSAAARHGKETSNQANHEITFGKAELGGAGGGGIAVGDGDERKERAELEGLALSEEENRELERRRRAAELEGRGISSPVKGWSGERAELEGRRREGSEGRWEIG
ncbi:hypothetical protein BKA65DRAFT_560371 [Rhexocercosporidium sp. MPI-PUGE-AT-0058]|nr:hypothetical protein BKA65DRAFT_560371 [Rhexocercosporidium sp. MPI-PUGE-AT-0058]